MKVATWIAVFLASIVGLVIAAVVVGLYADEEVRVRRMATYQQPPEAIWALISDQKTYPDWRSDVDHVDEIKSVAGGRTWVQTGDGSKMTMTLVEATGGRRLVMRTYDASLPFEGEWIMTISDKDAASDKNAASTLTVTERKKHQQPLDRFLATYVRNSEADVDRLLVDLGRRFGEQVEPQPAP